MKRCCGQATVVRADHFNSWRGVELRIPLLKHINKFYFVLIPCVTNAYTWEVTHTRYWSTPPYYLKGDDPKRKCE